MGKSAMKRIAIRGVVLLLVLSLTGCGVKEAGQQSPDTQKQDGTKEVMGIIAPAPQYKTILS